MAAPLVAQELETINALAMTITNATLVTIYIVITELIVAKNAILRAKLAMGQVTIIAIHAMMDTIKVGAIVIVVLLIARFALMEALALNALKAIIQTNKAHALRILPIAKFSKTINALNVMMATSLKMENAPLSAIQIALLVTEQQTIVQNALLTFFLIHIIINAMSAINRA